MKRKESKNLLAVCMIMVVCLVAWWASSIQGGVRKFEIKPEISLPESRTDAVRAIDAYESVTNRLMDMTERNLAGIHAEVKDISRMLVTIDTKLTELSKRMSKMEEALVVSTFRTNPTLESSGKDAKIQNNRTAVQELRGISEANCETVETR